MSSQQKTISEAFPPDLEIGEVISSEDPRLEGFAHPELEKCEFCGGPRPTMGLVTPMRIIWAPYGAERCGCEQAVEKYEREKAAEKAAEEAEKKARDQEELLRRIEALTERSGMNRRFLRRRFETFEITDENRKAALVCRDYAERFKEITSTEKNGLFIAGLPGTGKTHLAAAIANELLAKGVPVICMTMIDLLTRIRETYQKSIEFEGDVLALYKKVDLLIIDDIGKETPTDWAISTIYNIVNGRYEAALPTIVTTNYSKDELIKRFTPAGSGDSMTARATLDRLTEMCRGVGLAGRSWREPR